MSNMVKGLGIDGCRRFMTERLGEPRYAAMVSRAPQELRATLMQPLPASWYSTQALDVLTALYAEERGFRSTDEARSDFEAIGYRIAEDNLNGIYRALLRVLSAHGAVPMMPRVWAQYFKGHSCDLDWDKKRTNASITVHNLSVQYLAPIAAGWQQAALRLSTDVNAQVVEENYARGVSAADPMVFRFSW
jgi:hypothetical protein